MTELLTPQQVAAGWQLVESAASLQHVRPLSDAARRVISEAQSGRVELGFQPFDREMRGISPGHLVFITGYAHSAKTLLMLNMVHHNAGRRIALFSPDEPAPLVLIKLASLLWQRPVAELEAKVAGYDPETLRLVRETVEHYPNLLIFDRPISPRLMRACYEEARDVWSEDADVVILDYLDLLQAGELSNRADAVKAFASDFEVPLVVLHQTSRSSGSKGQAMRIDSGNFGGETWATFQLGVRRKKAAIDAEIDDLQRRSDGSAWIVDRLASLAHDRAVHEYTVTVNLTKNKRPGGRLVGEVDFELDHATGALRPLDGLPHQFLQAHHRGLRVVRDDPWEEEREARW